MNRFYQYVTCIDEIHIFGCFIANTDNVITKLSTHDIQEICQGTSAMFVSMLVTIITKIISESLCQPLK